MENNKNAAEAIRYSGEPKSSAAVAQDQNPTHNDANANANNGIHADVSSNNSSAAAVQGGAADGNRTRRTPFTDLSQLDADLALARTLQEQERAYMMLSMGADGIPYGSWEVANYEHEDGEDEDFDDPSEEEFEGSDVDEDYDEEEQDAFDVHAQAEVMEDGHQGSELDPSAYPSDEAYARALQDAEEREMAARMFALAGIEEVVGGAEDDDDHDGNSQDAWEDVDPDELSYEELIALGEVVGTESRGLSADTIASLPSVNYKSQSSQYGSSESCVICRSDFEDGETLTVLSCKHSYHAECIDTWLHQNKVCPICNAEVSTSGNS